jgi:uncharacterized repeat protein (TIGR01451 family)
MSSSVHAYIATEWTSNPGGLAIATDASDNVYTAHSDINPGSEINLTKRDSAGNTLWVASAPNIDVGYEVANWLSIDNNGNIIVTGILQGGSFENRTNRAGLVMKFDPAGNLLWSQNFDGIDNGSYTRTNRVDSNNNIYVLGVGNGIIAKVKKYAPNGTLRWSYGDIGTLTYPYNLNITLQNNVLVMTSASAISGSIVYAKLDTNGNQLWRKLLSSRSSGYAADDSLGNTYLVHMEYGVTDEGTVIKKLSSTGTLIWETKRKGMITPFVIVGSDNAPVISGLRPSVGAAFVKYASDGNVLWQNLDADGPGFALQQWSPSQMDDENNVYVQGLGALCKVNNNGAPAWATSNNSNNSGFSVGSDYSVYTVGATTAKLIEIPGSAPSVDLSLTLSVTPNSVTLGQTISYTANVTNNGPSPATGVTVTGSVTTMTSCNIGNLAPGETDSCILTEKSSTTGVFSRTVTVTGTEADPNFINNRIETFITVLPATTASDLVLTLVDAPDPVRRGTNLVYTLTVQNNGPSNAGSITLRDVLPTNVTFVSAVPTQGTCTGTAAVTCALGTLNTGAKTSMKITIKPKTVGVISNSASISSAIVADPDTTNNSKTVTTSVIR